MQAEEANLEFEEDVDLGEEKPVESNLGRVGWCLFYNFNLLVDCQHCMLALCDSLQTLKEQGYPVDSFTEAPLLLDRGLIEFETATDENILRCILDTGSTWNMLNKDLKNGSNDHMTFTSTNTDQYLVLNPENRNFLTFDPKNVCEIPTFKIQGKEFGPLTFNCIKSPLSIEAIIGMEFFESTLVFIDFANRKIYFYELPVEKEIPTLAG